MAVSEKNYRVSSTQYDKDSVWGFDSKSYNNTQFNIYKQKSSGLDSIHTVLVCPYIANPKIISFTAHKKSGAVINTFYAIEGTTRQAWEQSAFNTTGKTGDEFHIAMGGWSTGWAGEDVLEDGGKYYFSEPL